MHRTSILRLMIKVSLLMCCFSTYYINASNLPPKPSGPVADYAGIFDNATKLKINSIARTLWVENKFGLIVATVPEMGAVSIEKYAADVYRLWGAGMKTSPENALILISVNPRVAYIHVGIGAHRYLSAQMANRLLAHHGMPYFSNSDYNNGIIAFSHELSEAVRNDRGTTGTSSGLDFRRSTVNIIITHPVHSGVIGGVALLLLMISITGKLSLRKRRPDYTGCGFGGGAQGGAFGALIRR